MNHPLVDSELGSESSKDLQPPIPIFGCPAHDAQDRVALEMLQRVLDPARCDLPPAFAPPRGQATKSAARFSLRPYKLSTCMLGNALLASSTKLPGIGAPADVQNRKLLASCWSGS